MSKDIASEDLTHEQVAELATQVVREELMPWADQAYELVRGQPYLTQVLLAAAARGEDDEERQSCFDEAVETR